MSPGDKEKTSRHLSLTNSSWVHPFIHRSFNQEAFPSTCRVQGGGVQGQGVQGAARPAGRGAVLGGKGTRRRPREAKHSAGNMPWEHGESSTDTSREPVHLTSHGTKSLTSTHVATPPPKFHRAQLTRPVPRDQNRVSASLRSSRPAGTVPTLLGVGPRFCRERRDFGCPPHLGVCGVARSLRKQRGSSKMLSAT